MRKIQEIKNIARHQLTEKYKLIIWPFAVSTVLNVSPFSFSLSLSIFYPSLSRSTSLSKSISVTPEIPALAECPRLSLSFLHPRSSAWPRSPSLFLSLLSSALPFIPKYLSGEFVNFRSTNTEKSREMRCYRTRRIEREGDKGKRKGNRG